MFSIKCKTYKGFFVIPKLSINKFTKESSFFRNLIDNGDKSIFLNITKMPYLKSFKFYNIVNVIESFQHNDSPWHFGNCFHDLNEILQICEYFDISIDFWDNYSTYDIFAYNDKDLIDAPPKVINEYFFSKRQNGSHRITFIDKNNKQSIFDKNSIYLRKKSEIHVVQKIINLMNRPDFDPDSDTLIGDFILCLINLESHKTNDQTKQPTHYLLKHKLLGIIEDDQDDYYDDEFDNEIEFIRTRCELFNSIPFYIFKKGIMNIAIRPYSISKELLKCINFLDLDQPRFILYSMSLELIVNSLFVNKKTTMINHFILNTQIPFLIEIDNNGSLIFCNSHLENYSHYFTHNKYNKKIIRIIGIFEKALSINFIQDFHEPFFNKDIIDYFVESKKTHFF